MEKQTPKTKEQARQYAIDWQKKFSESDMGMDWKELCNWNEVFTKLGKKFGLLKEFKENGII
jgi:hypothetical protein